MARKKKTYDPRQLSFSFEVMTDHMIQLKIENTVPDTPTTKEVLYGTGQTNQSAGNSPKDAISGNNLMDSQPRMVQQLGLFDLGQMGAEQPRQSSGTGSERGNSHHGSAVPAAGNRTEPAQESGRDQGPRPGAEHLGNIPESRHQHGAGSELKTMLQALQAEQLLSFISVGDNPQENPPQDALAEDFILSDTANTRSEYAQKNYRITEKDRLGEGGAKTKYADNIAAIRLLKELQAQGAKTASPEEQKILVRYVGWGGLQQAFDPINQQWNKEYAELQALLPEQEYAEARRSTQDAHYTPTTVVEGVYKGLKRLGIQKQEIPLFKLESSVGTGNFLGLAPEEQQYKTVAVELDSTSAAIAKYLYPEATVINQGFQNTKIADNFFDLAVGNPPFGSHSLFDPDHTELNKFSVHNYFIAKSLAKVREGGVGAFVVSRFFLDAKDTSARSHIADQAEFLGAIRLPNSTFKQNALAEVTTDIVFFRKNTASPNNKDWVETGNIRVLNPEDKSINFAPANSYFAQNPSQIIGRMVQTGGAFRDLIHCVADDSTDLAAEIEKRLSALPQDVFTPVQSRQDPLVQRAIDHVFLKSPYFKSLKPGAFCLEPKTNVVVYKKIADFGEYTYAPVPIKRDSEQLRLTGIIGIRDALRSLLEAEKTNATDTDIETARRALNVKYDAFVKKYGYLNSTMNRSIMREEPEHSLLESLEVAYDKGISADLAKKQNRAPKPASAQKAAIFTNRVLQPAAAATHADSPKDALVICLREKGKVNLEHMATLTGLPAEEIKKDLQHQQLVFLSPSTLDWEIRDKYLTGNVKEKLHQAQEAAQKDPQFALNVEALTQVQPPEIDAVDIGIKLGSSWVPAMYIKQFVKEVIGDGFHDVTYLPPIGKWHAKIQLSDWTANTNTWGTEEYPANKLIESILHNTPIKVQKDSGRRDDKGQTIMVVDQELTAAAMQKADQVKQAFLDWVWAEEGRRKDLAGIYNAKFNTHIPPRYDGSHIALVNASSDITLRPHQKDVVWRGIQEGGGLFDHVVGAGKTLAATGTAMEAKRMGFVNKPMFNVPNHLIYQWRDEFYRLYPDAKILVAEKEDFKKENRERFFSRIATGDWDAVIVPHSSFSKIEMPRETQERILTEQIRAITDAIKDMSSGAKGGGNIKPSVKQLERQKEAMQARFDKLLAMGGQKDRAVDFADLGVDALFVDESQEYKNLGFVTTMNVSGLGNITGSAKALDLFIKCRYLQEKNNGRGVYFLTGTSISNSISEVYTQQRYLQYDDLAQKGLEHFDAWASTFGQVTSNWELDATGVNYKLKSRFAKFENVPELLSMFRSFADVITKEDLDEQAKRAGKRPLTPPLHGGAPQMVICERSPAQASYMDSIIRRMEQLPPDPRKDNPLKITNDARKAGLDFRLIDPYAEDFAASKVNAAVESIHTIWKDTTDVKGTQLVFCDLSTPKGGSKTTVPAAASSEESSVDDELVESSSDEETTDVTNMDDLVATFGSSKFSVYDDMRQKLIAKGIPEEQIAFIHDANTNLRKAKLFADMRRGDVRVLIGSTSKMGAGTNVQERLVWLHDMDAPWRPSDLEQRHGRLIRQGNKLYEQDPDNFKVGISLYATKQTYDARMWQTIEYKAAAIEQFRKGDILQRVIDDVTSEAATAAEMKAAASGNPLILLQVKLAADLRKLEALSAQHKRAQHTLQDRISWLKNAEKRFEKVKDTYEANCRLRDSKTHKTIKDGKEKIQILFTNPEGALLNGEKDGTKIMQAFQSAISNIQKSGRQLEIGTYRGFKLFSFQRFSEENHFRISITGTNGQEFAPDNLCYHWDDKFSLGGCFQRLDNFLDKGLESRFQDAEIVFKREKTELERAQANLGQDFPQQAELALVRENYGSVMRELQRMQEDKDYVSEWSPKTLEQAGDTPPALRPAAEETPKQQESLPQNNIPTAAAKRPRMR